MLVYEKAIDFFINLVSCTFAIITYLFQDVFVVAVVVVVTNDFLGSST